jgi:hypothetical protein
MGEREGLPLTSHDYEQPATQAERLAQFHNERLVRERADSSTFHSHAHRIIEGEDDRRSPVIDYHPPAGKAVERDADGRVSRHNGTELSGVLADYEPPIDFEGQSSPGPVGEYHEIHATSNGSFQSAPIQTVPIQGRPDGLVKIPAFSPETYSEAEHPELLDARRQRWLLDHRLVVVPKFPGYAMPLAFIEAAYDAAKAFSTNQSDRDANVPGSGAGETAGGGVAHSSPMVASGRGAEATSSGVLPPRPFLQSMRRRF